jgi:hypothetical protein
VLIEEGKLEMKGDVKNMKEFEVKLAQAVEVN